MTSITRQLLISLPSDCQGDCHVLGCMNHGYWRMNDLAAPSTNPTNPFPTSVLYIFKHLKGEFPQPALGDAAAQQEGKCWPSSYRLAIYAPCSSLLTTTLAPEAAWLWWLWRSQEQENLSGALLSTLLKQKLPMQNSSPADSTGHYV